MKQGLIKISDFIKKHLKWITIFICIIILLVLIENVKDNDIAKFDEKGYSIVFRFFALNTKTPIALYITSFANTVWLIGLSIVLLILIKNKKIGASICINLGLSSLVNYILKQVLKRPRPIENVLLTENGYSFPSGHSMVSMAFYGFLIYLIFKNVKNKYLKFGLITLLSILIICIGMSRIYLGVHYTSDVIAGFLVGIIYLVLFIHITKKK